MAVPQEREARNENDSGTGHVIDLTRKAGGTQMEMQELARSGGPLPSAARSKGKERLLADESDHESTDASDEGGEVMRRERSLDCPERNLSWFGTGGGWTLRQAEGEKEAGSQLNQRSR